MQKILFKLPSVSALQSIEDVFGQETGAFTLPMLNQTIEFLAAKGTKPTKFQNKIYKVVHIHSQYIPDDAGNITEEVVIRLIRISTKISVLLRKTIKT